MSCPPLPSGPGGSLGLAPRCSRETMGTRVALVCRGDSRAAREGASSPGCRVSWGALQCACGDCRLVLFSWALLSIFPLFLKDFYKSFNTQLLSWPLSASVSLTPSGPWGGIPWKCRVCAASLPFLCPSRSWGLFLLSPAWGSGFQRRCWGSLLQVVNQGGQSSPAPQQGKEGLGPLSCPLPISGYVP